MATIEQIIDNCIAENNIDPKHKEALCDCYTKCMHALAKHLISEPIQNNNEAPKQKSSKVLKADKLDNPSSAEKIEDLRNCTTGVLNQFCKDNFLKVGGNKTEIIERVWRHLQGETSDDDKSSRNKPRKEKKKQEMHECNGCNAKGAPCATNGTNQHGQYWFCWRHIEDADKFISELKSPDKVSEKKSEKVKKMVKKIEKEISELEESDEDQ